MNLIGEHVDYSGYSVVPMAIEHDTMMAVARFSSSSSPLIVLRNVDSRFPPCDLPCSLQWQSSLSGSHWRSYVAAGLRGALESSPFFSPSSFSMPPMSVLVDGRVPIGSGLSSSSAMVCCASLAAMRVIEMEKEKEKNTDEDWKRPSMMAAMAARCERWIGMESGGMDQAISMMAKEGCALHIQFDPLVGHPVKLSDETSVVIVDSGVQSCKYATATTGYNLRVVECRFAAALLAKHCGVDISDGKMRTLKKAQEACGGKSLSEMATLVRQVIREGPFTAQQVAEALQLPNAEQLYGNPTLSGPYMLRDRALHVFEESDRVRRFVESGCSAETMGKLMNESHQSCDQQFDCSCAELNELTDVCRNGGALGARLTGAGWGGWGVCLVSNAKLQSFVDYVWDHYYAPKEVFRGKSKNDCILVSKPSPGANIIRV